VSRAEIVRAHLEQAVEAVLVLRSIGAWTVTPIAGEAGDVDLGYRAESELQTFESLGGERRLAHADMVDGHVRVISTVTLVIGRTRFIASREDVMPRPEFERRMRVA